MNSVGIKLSNKPFGLGVKSHLTQSLGNKLNSYPNIRNIITPDIPRISVLGINNLIPNHSNSSEINYHPTGLNLHKQKIRKSYLEKK